MLYSCIASSHPGVKPDTILESGGGGGGGHYNNVLNNELYIAMNLMLPDGPPVLLPILESELDEES